MEKELTIFEKITIRRQKLENAKKNLKAYFIGLDEIIDKLFNNMEAWYLLPEIISRPTIINMWGLTGTGKTDLIRRMVKELEFNDKFVEIQMDSTSVETSENSWGCNSVKKVLSHSSIAEDDAGILFLDEMQRFRTVSITGEDMENKAFSDVWMLLSDGKFNSNVGSKSSLLELILFELYYDDHRNDDENATPVEANWEATSDKKKTPAKNHKYHRNVYQAKELKTTLKLTEPISEIMMWTKEKKIEMIENKLNDPDFSVGASYSKLLIIIGGNIDEAYSMSRSCSDADVEADSLHAFSKTITIIDIKDALLKRFKPEQIARFGNTHIIYPAFSKKSFQELIIRRCKKIMDDVSLQTGIEVKLTERVYDAIYANGVFPAQGVRPLFTTISNMLESNLPTFIIPALVDHAKSIVLDCEGDFMFSTIGNKNVEAKIERPIDSIKNDEDENSRALICVHEAGHAVAYALLFKTAPLELKASLSSNENKGYMMRNGVNTNKANILKGIQTCLAGRVAEEVVFGCGYESAGAQGDIARATDFASDYVRCMAMDGFVCKIGAENHQMSNIPWSTNIETTNQVIEDLLKTQKAEVSTLIQRNLKFLKEVSTTLLDQGEIKPECFVEIAKKYGLSLEIMKHGKPIYGNYRQKMKSFFDDIV